MNADTSLGRDADCIMLTLSFAMYTADRSKNPVREAAISVRPWVYGMHCRSLLGAADLLLDEGLSVRQVHAQAALQLLPHHLLRGLLHRSQLLITLWGTSLQSTPPSSIEWSIRRPAEFICRVLVSPHEKISCKQHARIAPPPSQGKLAQQQKQSLCSCRLMSVVNVGRCQMEGCTVRGCRSEASDLKVCILKDLI